MPRLSMFRPEYSKDFYWIDRSCREWFLVSGVAVYIHRYLGAANDARDSTGPAQPVGDSGLLGIQDLLLMENRDRKYDKNIYELRGIYNQNDTDFDLSQFGLFLANDNIFISFHINDMVERMGRPLMNGDVLELPNLKDPFALLNVSKALKRFYVVQDTSRSSEGFSPTWYPHVWRAKIGPLVDSQEYKQIFGDGSNPKDLLNYLSTYNATINNNNAVVSQAETDVPLSGFDTSMFWVNPTNPDGTLNTIEIAETVLNSTDPNNPDVTTENNESLSLDNEYTFGSPRKKGYLESYLQGDGAAPNDLPTGFGTFFPVSPASGDYFKRTDFLPSRLFRYDGYKWIFIETQTRTNLTNNDTKNTMIDTFINNSNRTQTQDGTGSISEKQTLNNLLKPKAD